MLYTQRVSELKSIQKQIIEKLISKTREGELTWNWTDESCCNCHPKSVLMAREGKRLYILTNYLEIWNDNKIVGSINNLTEMEDLREAIEDKLNPQAMDSILKTHREKVKSFSEFYSKL